MRPLIPAPWVTLLAVILTLALVVNIFAAGAFPNYDGTQGTYVLGGLVAGVLGLPFGFASHFAPQLMLPALRSDMEMYERYVLADYAPLSCPITVLYGASDRSTSSQSVQGWSQLTTAACTIECMEGGHFFVFDAPNRAGVVNMLTS